MTEQDRRMAGGLAHRMLLAVLLTVSLTAIMVPSVRAETTPVAKKAAIAMFGPHASLQHVADGFKAALGKSGLNVVYDEGHVNFDRSLVPQFLNRLAAGRPDVMLTVTTPMSQSAKQVLARRTFPIVFAPVSDPVQAGLLPSWERGAPLLAGVSNIPDFDATLDFMKTLIPGMKRLAILYNTGDDSDIAFLNRLEASAPGHGVQVVRIGVDNANDIAQRVASARGRADALFVPSSSMLQPASPAIASAAARIALPVFGSNTPTVDDGHMLAVLAVDFWRVGEKAGELAGRLLKGEDPQHIPVQTLTAADHLMRISQRRMDALGLSLPPALQGCDCVVP